MLKHVLSKFDKFTGVGSNTLSSIVLSISVIIALWALCAIASSSFLSICLGYTFSLSFLYLLDLPYVYSSYYRIYSMYLVMYCKLSAKCRKQPFWKKCFFNINCFIFLCSQLEIFLQAHLPIVNIKKTKQIAIYINTFKRIVRKIGLIWTVVREDACQCQWIHKLNLKSL